MDRVCHPRAFGRGGLPPAARLTARRACAVARRASLRCAARRDDYFTISNASVPFYVQGADLNHLLVAALAKLDTVLQERTFLVGDAVSLADIAVVCAVRGFQDEFASLTAVKRWFATCVNQPAFRCVQPAVASCALSVRAAVCAQFGTRGVFASLMRRLPFSTNSAVLQIDAAAGPSALSSATTSPAPDEPNIGELRPIGFACDLKNPSDAPPLETALATTSPCARA